MKKIGVLMLGVVLLSSASVFAGGGLWQGNVDPNNYLWTHDAGWEAGAAPTVSDAAYITWAGSLPLAENAPTIGDANAAECDTLLVGWTGFGNQTAILDMTGGTLHVVNFLAVGHQDPGQHPSSGLFNLSGGEVTIDGTLGIGWGGTGRVNMTGGTVTTEVLAFAPVLTAFPEWICPGHLDLHGGVILVNDGLALNDGLWSIDIEKGVLVVNGELTGVDYWVDRDWITAYRGKGTVMWDYNVTNTGKTTIWACGLTNPTGDFDADCDVDLADLATLAGNWLVDLDS